MAHGQQQQRVPSLERYVLAGEEIIVNTRQHWGRLVWPVAITVLALLVVVWVDSKIKLSGAAAIGFVVWMLWLVLLAWLIFQIAEWRYDRFVATDKRLMLTMGLVTRKVGMMPLFKVTDMSYERSFLGRIFGYGRFILESAGQDQALRNIDWVPHPDKNYRIICAKIFGVEDPDDVVVEETKDGTVGAARVANPLGRVSEAGPEPRGAGRADEWSYSQAIPVQPRADDPDVVSGEVVYMSDQNRVYRRAGDTGPIPIRPEADD